MTQVRANVSLAGGIRTGSVHDVDVNDATWANWVRAGHVTIIDGTDPAATWSPAEDAVRKLNVADTLDLVDSGRFTAAEVLAAERETKNRSTVINALTREPPSPAEESSWDVTGDG